MAHKNIKEDKNFRYMNKEELGRNRSQLTLIGITGLFLVTFGLIISSGFAIDNMINAAIVFLNISIFGFMLLTLSIIVARYMDILAYMKWELKKRIK